MNLLTKPIISSVFIFAAVVLFLGAALFYVRDPFPEPYAPFDLPLNRTNVRPGTAVKPGTELRILCVGDSITWGSLSDRDGGDGNGYRLQLWEDLSEDEVVFVGSESKNTMPDGYFAAWPGKTINFMGEHLKPSLKQRPNIILLHAGTNDLDNRPWLGREGNEPHGIAERLGGLVDQLIEACPDATILIAIIIGTCDPHKATGAPEYQSLIPATVQKRRAQGHHVLAVNFAAFPMDQLRDCIHPTNNGYKEMGHYWFDFITQIPVEWIQPPIASETIRHG
ncbi:SGNH hydrolase-type esterase domain-containing protein [Mariannaea sp. PMI_226]|nr:SGNH hydrolase-type esterase domain-containing protein [Mariannaea sp. PMI_226]